MTLAEKRLQVIADATDQLAQRVRRRVNKSDSLDRDLSVEVATFLEAISVFAKAADPEPESFRVYDGLRVVR